MLRAWWIIGHRRTARLAAGSSCAGMADGSCLKSPVRGEKKIMQPVK
jgi:hypothetical protein